MQQVPIHLQETRFNYLPYRFMLRGTVQRVRRVERAWDVRAGWRQREGRFFRVLCQDNSLLDLFHDIHLNAWYATPKHRLTR